MTSSQMTRPTADPASTTPTDTTPTDSHTPERVGRPSDFYLQLHHPSLPKWRPVLALVTFGILALIVNAVLSGGTFLAQAIIDGVPMGQITQLRLTPLIFLGLNLSLAALWPISVLCEKLFFKGYAGSVTSSTGRLPWKRIGRLTLAFTPVFAVYSWISLRFLPDTPAAGPMVDVVLLMAVALLTTPLQAAGEEVAFRGFLPRVFGSFTAHRRVAIALATVIPSVLFMFAHGAGDLWLNAYYLIFGACLAVVTVCTGNIGGAMVLHVLNNLGAFLAALIAGLDMSGIFDRQAGAGGPFMLIPMLVVPVLSAIIVVIERNRRDA